VRPDARLELGCAHTHTRARAAQQQRAAVPRCGTMRVAWWAEFATRTRAAGGRVKSSQVPGLSRWSRGHA
jgi:hypothetical protein